MYMKNAFICGLVFRLDIVLLTFFFLLFNKFVEIGVSGLIFDIAELSDIIHMNWYKQGC